MDNNDNSLIQIYYSKFLDQSYRFIHRKTDNTFWFVVTDWEKGCGNKNPGRWLKRVKRKDKAGMRLSTSHGKQFMELISFNRLKEIIWNGRNYGNQAFKLWFWDEIRPNIENLMNEAKKSLVLG